MEEIIKLTALKKDNYCCVNDPLLSIDLDHIILDELNFLLRVTDVLINNLIDDVLEMDKKKVLSKKKLDPTRGAHLQQFIKTVSSWSRF